MYRKILVPIDGSGNANKALDVASQLSRGFSSRIYLLNVTQGTDKSTDSERQKNAAMHIIQTSMETIDAAGIDTEILIREGEPVDIIEREAQRLDVDAIVMGYRGLGKTDNMMGGSVSRAINHCAVCRVITVR